MLRYRLLLALLWPLLAGYTAWQALRAREPRYLRERLGYARPAGARGGLWLHAASVGEVNAALPLIRRLQAQAPELSILVSTVTTTGAGMVRQQLGDTVRHAYLPLDGQRPVNRFLRAHRPACAVIMETELWPQLFAACARRAVPLLIVNARLSERTLGAGAWLRRLYAQALGGVSAILARSDEDAARYRRLGAPARRIRTLGNIKFAPGAGPATPLNLGRPYVLAASTHDDEERQLVRLWRDIASGGRLLVIAPRHPQRLPAILKQLRPLGLRLAIRSRHEPVQADTAVYLADTFGELPGLIAGADLVFMGGSLVPRGGHNILEVGLAGKPVVFGPHMHNFAQEAETFLSNGAGVQVTDAAELRTAFDALLANPAHCAAMGAQGRRLMAAQAGVLQAYVEAVRAFCPGGPGKTADVAAPAVAQSQGRP